jgi:hypothetical protein
LFNMFLPFVPFSFLVARLGVGALKMRFGSRKLSGALSATDPRGLSRPLARKSFDLDGPRIEKLMRTLRAKYQGHWNYYGIIGNSANLSRYRWQTARILFRWLNRRSQRRGYTWRAFNRLLQRFQVPPPRIVEGVSEGLARVCHTVEQWGEQAKSVNLFGEHYRPCGCASELR